MSTIMGTCFVTSLSTSRWECSFWPSFCPLCPTSTAVCASPSPKPEPKSGIPLFTKYDGTAPPIRLSIYLNASISHLHWRFRATSRFSALPLNTSLTTPKWPPKRFQNKSANFEFKNLCVHWNTDERIFLRKSSIHLRYQSGNKMSDSEYLLIKNRLSAVFTKISVNFDWNYECNS